MKNAQCKHKIRVRAIDLLEKCPPFLFYQKLQALISFSGIQGAVHFGLGTAETLGTVKHNETDALTAPRERIRQYDVICPV